MRADVVIVGYGPVALSTAIILNNCNIKTIIIKQPKPQNIKSGPGKLLAISISSRNLFQKYHIVRNIISVGQPINSIEVAQYQTNAKLVFCPKDIGEQNFGYFIDEKELWQSLHQDLDEVNIIESDISKIQQSEHTVAIKLDDGQLIKTNLLVISDGKDSITRRKCGFQSIQKPYNQVAIICNIAHDKHHRGIAREVFMHSGPFATLPDKNGYKSSIVWTLPNTSSDFIKALTVLELQQLIAPHCDESLGNIILLSTPSIYNLVLDYATHAVNGRILLAGDTLHSIHPLAGQGLNLGLRDVDCLVTLITKNHNLGLDIGSSNLLSHYNTIRIDDAQNMISTIGLIDNIYKSNYRIVQSVGSFAIDMMQNFSLLKKIFMHYAAGNHLN